jgi:hypothetical protein
MLEELDAQNTPLSNALKNKLIERILQRRNKNSELFQYLSNPKQSYDNDHGVFNRRLSKAQI